MGRIDFGKEGESIAIEYLLSKGYKILEKNFRTKFGEIDIIAKEGEYIVIIEVKRRMSDSFGSPELSVNPKKQEKLKKLALLYLYKLGKEHPVRFDVIAIRDKEIEHIENAFY
ncbi:MAG: YraN family protein [Thermodesulfovibrio sp.]|jgi:putative endonuclease|uniref:YraN family protein n=1 Tax=unclassified Thermodesulfovibrio TaxID=2645936 RepID=UPI00083A0752|nr:MULTISPECIES: YraN family protein [unclassified Thermodesulfovibrio]MDI1472823.1 YraN family protein [Thermodesulfovibrio sp. 1176]MDI6713523.1 YraN family protein [Thermodesulfovibrio sp.]ODA43386.1 Endonuclease [Thermodesulfovibrio sp. N1]